MVNIIEGVVFLLNIRENVLSNEIDGNFNSNWVLVLFFLENLFFIINDEEVWDFEILFLEIMDSFWKCDIGCFNIDCVDFC